MILLQILVGVFITIALIGCALNVLMVAYLIILGATHLFARLATLKEPK